MQQRHDESAGQKDIPYAEPRTKQSYGKGKDSEEASKLKAHKDRISDGGGLKLTYLVRIRAH